MPTRCHLGHGCASLLPMSLVWLPIKLLLLGGVTLAGVATLGHGLGALIGLCCARQCRAERLRADAVADPFPVIRNDRLRLVHFYPITTVFGVKLASRPHWCGAWHSA